MAGSLLAQVQWDLILAGSPSRKGSARYVSLKKKKQKQIMCPCKFAKSMESDSSMAGPAQARQSCLTALLWQRWKLKRHFFSQRSPFSAQIVAFEAACASATGGPAGLRGTITKGYFPPVGNEKVRCLVNHNSAFSRYNSAKTFYVPPADLAQHKVQHI